MTPNEYQKAALRTESVNVPRVIERLLNLKTGEGDTVLAALKMFNGGKDIVGESDNLRLANGLIGLNGEAGEALDIFKKYLFQAHQLDKEHLAKELGDIAWYLAVSANAIGYDLETIFEMNINKLHHRYPGEGFDAEHSINRAEGDV